MPRLFFTSKEAKFWNDIVKEYTKDVNGQVIYYYPISYAKTQVHHIYQEAINKIFENPIKLDVLAGQPNWETRHNNFGIEQSAKFEIFVQARDLIDKNITITEGDYFTYADAVFEIQSFINVDNIFGHEEYDNTFKIIGRLARPGTFSPESFFDPTKDNSGNYLETGVQKTFHQQRGLTENAEGITGDVRESKNLHGASIDGDEMSSPLDGPRKIDVEESGLVSSFYNEDLS